MTGARRALIAAACLMATACQAGAATTDAPLSLAAPAAAHVPHAPAAPVVAQGAVVPPTPPPTTASPSPTPTPTPSPQLTLPDGTRTLFPGHRLVAFYGAAGYPGLGILGTGSPDEVWPKLRRQAKPYRDAPPVVLPTYELITYLATDSRGNQGNYSSRVSDRTIRRYVRAAHRHSAMLILDIQPGRGEFIDDAKTLRRWMRLPYVGLALDPEWKLYGDQKPLEQIGHTTAGQINRVSRWLADVTRRNALPQKPLLVHQFTQDMVRHKERVKARAGLALVFNVDGFGSKGAKRSKYDEFARDRRFPLGFKLFYDYDHPVMTPREVLALRPRPRVVEYQ